jgi:hypothetical protein
VKKRSFLLPFRIFFFALEQNQQQASVVNSHLFGKTLKDDPQKYISEIKLMKILRDLIK